MVNLKVDEKELEGEYEEDEDGGGDEGLRGLMHGNEGDDATDIFVSRVYFCAVDIL